MNHLAERQSTVAAMLMEMGLDGAGIATRLRAVRFGPEDRERVRGLRGLIEAKVEEAAAAFIGYLLEAEETRSLFHDPRLVAEIRARKQAHIPAMTQGEYGTDYVAERIELAFLYGAAGLEVKWFLGAFHHLMRFLGLAIVRGGHDPSQAVQDFLALNKVAFFDIGLMVDVLIAQRERTIRRQQEAILELSTPVLQVRPRLLVLPLIGALDTERARQLTDQLLRAIRASRARAVVLDITGVSAVDSQVANHLVQTVKAAQLMGATTILSGVTAEVVQTMVMLGVELGRVISVGDLQAGLEEAERRLAPRGPTP